MNELPSNWCCLDFHEIFSDRTSTHKKIAQKDYLTEGAVPVIDQGMSLVGGFTNEIEHAYQDTLPVIVWGDHTKCIKYVDFPFVQGADGVRVLSPIAGALSSRFAYHLLRNADIPDKGYSRHYKYLKAAKFGVAPLREQERIANKLDKLGSYSGKARSELAHIPRLIERYKQAILSAAFRGDLTADWRAMTTVQVDAHSVLAKIKKIGLKSKKSKMSSRRLVEVDALPKSWAYVRLDEITTKIVDGTHHTPEYVSSGVPFISVKDIRDGKISFAECKFITTEAHRELTKRCLPETDDVLVTKSGTIGRCAIVGKDFDFSLFVSVALIKPIKPDINPFFIRYILEYWISTIDIQSEIIGSTIKNLHLQDIQALEIPLPPPLEQEKIVGAISAAYQKLDGITANQHATHKLLERLERATLQKAFKGELVAQDPNDEPATALLARIQSQATTAPAAKQKRKRSA